MIIRILYDVWITRIVNASVLIELGADAVLTDPYFEEHWFMRMREPIGLRVEQLPRLTAILGGHGVFDHWQPRSLEKYPFKAETPVFVATREMKKRALAAGFPRTEVLPWHAKVSLSDALELEVVPAQRALGMTSNNYLLATDQQRVFVGTEACTVDPLRAHRADLALLPIDGSALAGHQLVMTAEDAIAGARALGAETLVPIHYAMKPFPLLLQTKSSLDQLLAIDAGDLRIVPLQPGERRSFTTASRNI
jgi:L-ascorbate metabolism protein UlaG (beta-lactamase superfamily)